MLILVRFIRLAEILAIGIVLCELFAVKVGNGLWRPHFSVAYRKIGSEFLFYSIIVMQEA